MCRADCGAGNATKNAAEEIITFEWSQEPMDAKAVSKL